MNPDFSRMREKMTCSEPDLESIRCLIMMIRLWDQKNDSALRNPSSLRNDWRRTSGSVCILHICLCEKWQAIQTLKTGNYMQCRPLVLNFSYHNLFGLVETALCIPSFISAPPLSVNPRWPPCRSTGLQPEQEYKSSNSPTSPTLNLLFATWTH